MSILFTLCGRAGSKGLKSKNILAFCGNPLPYYSLCTIDLFRKKHADEGSMDIVLSTDSKQLQEMIRSAAPDCLIVDRDASLSGDMVRKIDVIRDAARRAAAHFSHEYEMVVDLDLTSPLRTLADLENVIEKRRKVDADVVYTVVPARRNPFFNQVMQHENGYYSTVCGGQTSTRQQAPKIFDMNASIYAYTPAYIDSNEPTFKYADIVEMKETGILDIDGPEDYELMQVIARFLYEKEPEFSAIRNAADELNRRVTAKKAFGGI